MLVYSSYSLPSVNVRSTTYVSISHLHIFRTEYLTQTIFPVVSTTFWMTWGLPNQRKNIMWPPCPLSIQADQHQVCSSSGRTVYHSSSTIGSLLKLISTQKVETSNNFLPTPFISSKNISNHHWGNKWCYKY